MNAYPFFNFDKRRKSQGIPSETRISTIEQLKTKYDAKAEDEKRIQSHYTIETMPKITCQSSGQATRNLQSHQRTHDPRTFNNQRNSKNKVSYWAGLRVEGGLQPFSRHADDMTHWNSQIHNGGLFEKIGAGM